MTALSVNAQSIKLGIKGGLDLTDMTLSKDDFSSSNRTGFFIGPTVKLSTGTGLMVLMVMRAIHLSRISSSCLLMCVMVLA